MKENALKAIRKFKLLSERIGTAGQPEAEQFVLIRDAGYEVLINLLPAERAALTNEVEIVAALGMDYVNIPVVWAAPQIADVERFFAAMDDHADRKVFVHCAVNMRVSAFMYLYRTLRLGMDEEEAEDDLHDLWVPDGVWADLIAAVQKKYQPV